MQKFFTWMIVISILSLSTMFLWSKVPAIKNTAHAVLDPTAGALINWDVTKGTLILFFVITLITTIIQKFATDQKTMKALKEEQKEVQTELQKYREHPEKALEINKKNMKIMGDIMALSMKSSAITFIPLVLLFRWFSDTFATLGNPMFFGFLSWIWLYIISSLVFGSILRKWLKMA